MPTFEGVCPNETCSAVGEVAEYLLRRWDDKDPECPCCGIQMKRVISVPNFAWAKDLGYYSGGNGEGHYVTYRDENNIPHKKFIRTRQEQLSFCREHGYADPLELPAEPEQRATPTKESKGLQRGTWA